MTSPIYVDWAITRACNLNCRHCVGMEEGELTQDEAVGVARNIISLSPKWIILEGGEPLLREDLPRIGQMFHKAGIDIFVITNGNAFNERRLRELASFSPRVIFSMDGADAETYEYVKRGAKFETARKWAARCADLGIFHGISTVLTRLNIGHVKDFIRLSESLGGKSVIFLPLKPFGNDAASHAYYEQYALTPKEHEEAVRDIYLFPGKVEIFYDEPFLWNLSVKHGFPISSSDSGITIPEVEGCAASYSLYIQTDGSVRPCMFCPPQLTFGNAAQEPLPDIWERMQMSPVLTGWAERKSRKGACAGCSGFESCRGCLARTTILLGDPLASDPCCPLAAHTSGELSRPVITRNT
jgi:radical SAM protein with 4Fe4S-binding SPASM domain